MRLRFAIYQESFVETEVKYEEHNWFRVLVYSGDDARKYYRDRHRRIQPGYLPYLILDMSSIGLHIWLKAPLADAVLGLSLREASKFEWFEWVLNKINEEVSDAFEAATLRTGVLLATLNKRGLWPMVLETIGMDRILHHELKGFLPTYEYQRRQYELEKQRDQMIRLLGTRQGTELLVERIQEMTEDEFDRERDTIFEAIIAGQEQTLVMRY